MQVRRVVGTVLSLESNNETAFIVLETAQSDRVYFKCSLHTRGYPPIVGEVIGARYVVEQGELRITDIDGTPDQYRNPDQHRDPFSQDRGTMTRTYDDGYSKSGRPLDVRSDTRPDGISVIVAINLIAAFMFGAGGFTFVLIPSITIFAGLLLLIAGSAVVLSYGLWMYEEWARVGMMVLAGIGCITIVGIFIGLPVIWYLNKDEIKNLYGAEHTIPSAPKRRYDSW